MARKRTLDEQIKDLDTQKEKLKQQMKAKENALQLKQNALKSRQSQAERKARTKRLIEIGATVEHTLGHAIEKEDLANLHITLGQQSSDVASETLSVIEHHLKRPMKKEDLEKLNNYLESQEKRGSFFTKAMNQG